MKTLIGILLASVSVNAQSLGSFASTGNLTVARMGHTATLLNNGKVLIAGGSALVTGLSVWASAELYDPTTGTFTPTGMMNAQRVDHTATLLPDGRVLIAGGCPDTNGGLGCHLASAELYNPATGAFTLTGEMNTGRFGHTATLLTTGKVLIAGGVTGDLSQIDPSQFSTAELYDISTETFTETGRMLNTGNLTATLLSDGKVLFEVNSLGPISSNELYDPSTGTFNPTAEKAHPDLIPVTASLLSTGDVLVTQEYSCDPSDQAELYDPRVPSSFGTGNMTAQRDSSTATLLPDGKVLIAGGSFPGLDSAGTADLYDVTTGTFSSSATMVTQSREEHTATLLPDGTVLFAGGFDCCGYTLSTAQIYSPPVLTPSPVLYALPGGQQGAILHGATQQTVSAANPVVSGEAIEIYGAGLLEGSLIPPQVAIGGQLAEVLFFGDAPGYAGLNQINARVPSGLQPGSALSVRMNYLARPSNEVTIAVQ